MTLSLAVGEQRGRCDEAPPAPERLADTGLSGTQLSDLILKTLHIGGARTGTQLAEAIGLPFPIIDEQVLELQQRRFLEVLGTPGLGRQGYLLDLVGEGRVRARQALEASHYVGPAPVPLVQYREWVERQSIRHARISPADLAAGLRHLVVDDAILETLGPAVNSAKSLFIYGAPGNGKTAVAEAIAHLLGDVIYVPYAVAVDEQVMVVHDPVFHRPAPDQPACDGALDQLLRGTGPGFDRRFARVQRPVVLVGGELTIEQLDLLFDPFAKLYQAPFQVKANGGILIVDDFGRQRVPPRDLLNRWVVPLDRRLDYLTLHTGGKFPVPFDLLLVFATNLDPQELMEEALLRRIHYKMRMPDPSEVQYRRIFERYCIAREIAFDPRAVDFVYERFYHGLGIAPRGCHPRDIVDHVEDLARFRGTRPVLSEEFLDHACQVYFLTPQAAPARGGPS